jgi:hypothetical protein
VSQEPGKASWGLDKGFYGTWQSGGGRAIAWSLAREWRADWRLIKKSSPPEEYLAVLVSAKGRRIMKQKPSAAKLLTARLAATVGDKPAPIADSFAKAAARRLESRA